MRRITSDHWCGGTKMLGRVLGRTKQAGAMGRNVRGTRHRACDTANSSPARPDVGWVTPDAPLTAGEPASGPWRWVGMGQPSCSAAAVVLLAAGRDGVGPAPRADEAGLARGGGRCARCARADGSGACRSCERLRCLALPGDAVCSLQAFEALAGRLHLIAGFERCAMTAVVIAKKSPTRFFMGAARFYI